MMATCSIIEPIRGIEFSTPQATPFKIQACEHLVWQKAPYSEELKRTRGTREGKSHSYCYNILWAIRLGVLLTGIKTMKETEAYNGSGVIIRLHNRKARRDADSGSFQTLLETHFHFHYSCIYSRLTCLLNNFTDIVRVRSLKRFSREDVCQSPLGG